MIGVGSGGNGVAVACVGIGIGSGRHPRQNTRVDTGVGFRAGVTMGVTDGFLTVGMGVATVLMAIGVGRGLGDA